MNFQPFFFSIPGPAYEKSHFILVVKHAVKRLLKTGILLMYVQVF